MAYGDTFNYLRSFIALPWSSHTPMQASYDGSLDQVTIGQCIAVLLVYGSYVLLERYARSYMSLQLVTVCVIMADLLLIFLPAYRVEVVHSYCNNFLNINSSIFVQKYLILIYGILRILE